VQLFCNNYEKLAVAASVLAIITKII